MLNFRKIELEDRELITEKLSEVPSQQLVNCFEAFYLWRDIYGIECVFVNDFVVFRMRGGVCFFPYGNGDLATIISELKGMKIIKATCENIRMLGHGVKTVASRDDFEYIYSTEKFVTYRGSALQSKRNFVNYAIKHYDWTYEPVSEKNLIDCAEFASEFAGDESFEGDNSALFNALKDYGRLNLAGGVIRIDGKIASLFMGSPLCDTRTLAGLFLRGKHEIKGVIPLLYREFFTQNNSYEFVNLAEDLGLEGLRKNKMSYNPDSLLELFTIC